MNPKKEWGILLTPQANRSLKRLKKQRQLIKRIDAALLSLADDPRPTGCKKLISKRYDNLYRIRVGDWRILYAIEDEEVIILILDVVRRDYAYGDM
jgi:mRNA interferase RelE/StbE